MNRYRFTTIGFVLLLACVVAATLIPIVLRSIGPNQIPANADSTDAAIARKLKPIAEYFGWDATGHVIDTDLGGDYVTDVLIDDVNKLKYLETLGLGPSGLDDACLARLEPNKIRSLGLAWTRITDKGVADLARFENLVYLDVSHTRISDASVVHLKRLSKLEYLFIEGTGITEEGEKQLRQRFPKCHIQRSTSVNRAQHTPPRDHG